MMLYNYANRLTNQANFEKHLPRGWRVLFFDMRYGSPSAYEPAAEVLVGIYNQEYKACVGLNVADRFENGECTSAFNVWSGTVEDGRETKTSGTLIGDAEKALNFMIAEARSINAHMAYVTSPLRVLCLKCGTVSGGLIDEGDSSVGIGESLDWTCPCCGSDGHEYDKKKGCYKETFKAVYPYEGCEADSSARMDIMRRKYHNEVEALKLEGELIKHDAAFDQWREKKTAELKTQPHEEFDHDGFWCYIDEFDRKYADEKKAKQLFA